jgi:hypothetical protein
LRQRERWAQRDQHAGHECISHDRTSHNRTSRVESRRTKPQYSRGGHRQQAKSDHEIPRRAGSREGRRGSYPRSRVRRDLLATAMEGRSPLSEARRP